MRRLLFEKIGSPNGGGEPTFKTSELLFCIALCTLKRVPPISKFDLVYTRDRVWVHLSKLFFQGYLYPRSKKQALRGSFFGS
ncbi:hypothetical protein SUGI_0178320 [Cryptomeria japonica]|nr:hypothetical protein SUGI_0178320 [Cryptomeria japonica]